MNHFQTIYQLAKAGQEETLRVHLHNNPCIDELEHTKPRMAAVAKLAFEGNLPAAKLLLSLGASRCAYIYGLAFAGKLPLTEINNLTEKDWAVKGAAQGGHAGLVTELLQRGAGINNATRGAAEGGHGSLVQALLKQCAHIRSISVKSLNDAVRGAAQGGHRDLVIDLLKKGADINYAIRGAAQGGYWDLVDDLLKKKGADINHAVREVLLKVATKIGL